VSLNSWYRRCTKFRVGHPVFMKCAYLVGILLPLWAHAKPKLPCELTLEIIAGYEHMPLVAVDYRGRYVGVVPAGSTTPHLIPLTSQPITTLPTGEHRVQSLSVSAPDGRRGLIAIGEVSGNTEVTALTGEPLYRIDPLHRPPTQLTFSPSGKWLLNVEPGLVTLHHSETGDLARSMSAPGIQQAAFSPLSGQIATAASDGTARLWWVADVHTSPAFSSIPAPKILRPRGPEITQIEFAPNTPLFAAGDREGGINLWNPASKRLIFPLQTTRSPVTALNFSLDGNRLLSTTEAGVGQVWNTNTGGSPIVIPAERYGRINAGYLIRDGKYALTAHDDGHVRIWELKSPKVNGRRNAEIYYEYSGHSGPVIDIKMLPDSAFLTVGADGTVRKGEIPRIPSTDPRVTP